MKEGRIVRMKLERKKQGRIYENEKLNENGKIKKEGKIQEKNREEVERVEEWTFERVEKEWDGKGRVESKNGERNNLEMRVERKEKKRKSRKEGWGGEDQ